MRRERRNDRRIEGADRRSGRKDGADEKTEDVERSGECYVSMWFASGICVLFRLEHEK